MKNDDNSDWQDSTRVGFRLASAINYLENYKTGESPYSEEEIKRIRQIISNAYRFHWIPQLSGESGFREFTEVRTTLEQITTQDKNKVQKLITILERWHSASIEECWSESLRIC